MRRHLAADALRVDGLDFPLNTVLRDERRNEELQKNGGQQGRILSGLLPCARRWAAGLQMQVSVRCGIEFATVAADFSACLGKAVQGSLEGSMVDVEVVISALRCSV